MIVAKKRFITIILLSWGFSPLWLLVWNVIEHLYGGDGFAAAFLTLLTIPCFGFCGTLIGFAACKKSDGCAQTMADILSRFSVLILWTLAIGWVFFHSSYL